MSLFSLPTADEVLDDSRLTEQQIKAAYSLSDALVDIGQKIAEAATVVEGLLVTAAAPYSWPLTDSVLSTAYTSYDGTARAAVITRQAAAATLAVKYLALADVYRSAGQLNKAYTDKADQFEVKAERILTGNPDSKQDTGLIGQVAWIIERQGIISPANTFSVQPHRSDGYSEWYEGQEYRRRWGC